MENNVCSRAIDALKAHFHHHPRPMILTGAGCSTGSGIADYRDKNGNWKHSPPVLFNDFVKNEATRKRYWARSMHGWPRIANAEPNAAHIALARLDAGGFIHQIITQNIDGLHQKAGSNNVIDLHGKLDSVKCIDCGYQTSRHTYQTILLEWNPNFKSRISVSLPDGDACLAAQDYSSFRFPECPACGGIYKPDVIFFGEFIPKILGLQIDFTEFPLAERIVAATFKSLSVLVRRSSLRFPSWV